MRNDSLHPRRKVLVEHISDDIRAARQRPATVQAKTLVTGRAIADVLSSDVFNFDVATDKKYFTDGRVDFNLCTDACIRFVDEDSYSNGPQSVSYKGFIHVAAVLPGGTISYDEENFLDRNGDPVAIRQIFYPNDRQDFDAYTRVGNWNSKEGEFDWSGWVSLSSRMIRVLVTESSVANQATNPIRSGALRTNVVYELHCGGQVILLPEADIYPTASKIYFEQYSNGEAIYTEVNTDSNPTPSPNVRYWTDKTVGSVERKVLAGTTGYITEFESGKKYYVQSAPSAWINIVRYTEKVIDPSTGEVKDEVYETQLIPSLDTIRTSDNSISSGAWFYDNEQACTFNFEIVDRESPVVYIDVDSEKSSSHTWMLDVDAEAVTAMSDMAELLDSHTDRMMTDIVQYEARTFKGDGGNFSGDTGGDYYKYITNNDGTLVVSRPATMCGYVKFILTWNKDGITNLSTDFKIQIFVYNEYSSSFESQKVFAYVPATETTPNMYKKYFILNSTTGKYELAGENGFLSSFESGKQYYTRQIIQGTEFDKLIGKFTFDLDGESKEYNAEFFSSESGTDGFKRGAPIFQNQSSMTGYIKANRNDTIMVVISSGNHVADRRIVVPFVEFYPDPHDSYVIKPNVNNTAVTNKELSKLSKPETPAEMVAGAQALTRAFEILAGTLQKKGLLYGAVPTGTGFDANAALETGIYTVNVEGSNLPAASGATNANLIVMDSDAYAKTTLLPTSEDPTTVNEAVSEFKRLTQILISNGNGTSGAVDASESYPRMWIRIGSKTPSDASASWGAWVPMQPGPTVFSSSADVTETAMKDYLRSGSPVVVVSGSDTATRTVTLPPPDNYAGTKFQIEAVGCPIKIQYTKSGTTYTYINSTTKESPNRMLYPVECDGTNWYVVTVS